jgi:hypothetical protein
VENCAQMMNGGKWRDIVCDLIVFGFDTFTTTIVCEKLIWI